MLPMPYRPTHLTPIMVRVTVPRQPRPLHILMSLRTTLKLPLDTHLPSPRLRTLHPLLVVLRVLRVLQRW